MAFSLSWLFVPLSPVSFIVDVFLCLSYILSLLSVQSLSFKVPPVTACQVYSLYPSMYRL
jgi:hypothetical protein